MEKLVMEGSNIRIQNHLASVSSSSANSLFKMDNVFNFCNASVNVFTFGNDGMDLYFAGFSLFLSVAVVLCCQSPFTPKIRTLEYMTWTNIFIAALLALPNFGHTEDFDFYNLFNCFISEVGGTISLFGCGFCMMLCSGIPKAKFAKNLKTSLCDCYIKHYFTIIVGMEIIMGIFLGFALAPLLMTFQYIKFILAVITPLMYLIIYFIWPPKVLQLKINKINNPPQIKVTQHKVLQLKINKINNPPQIKKKRIDYTLGLIITGFWVGNLPIIILNEIIVPQIVFQTMEMDLEVLNYYHRSFTYIQIIYIILYDIFILVQYGFKIGLFKHTLKIKNILAPIETYAAILTSLENNQHI